MSGGMFYKKKSIYKAVLDVSASLWSGIEQGAGRTIQAELRTIEGKKTKLMFHGKRSPRQKITYLPQLFLMLEAI